MTSRSSAQVGDVEFSDMDLHFGRFVSRLVACDRPELAAAAALASRATGNGEVCVQLSEFAQRPLPDLNVTTPALDSWLGLLRECSAVGKPGDFRPLVLDEKGRLYLYRYWDYEQRLAEHLLARAADVEGIDEDLLRDGLRRYFPNAADVEQKLAAAAAVLRRFCVISGGPGTGKTTTVVKILVLLAEQARGGQLSIGLAAPTGKAAARVQDAMRAALARLDVDLFTSEAMPREALTVHRLLGARADSVYYRHDRDNPLPLDVLVVDEASMADLALAVKLLEALPGTARLILLGDKDQLASVEAGAVLGDVCRGAGFSRGFAQRLASIAGVPVSKIRKSGNEASPLSDSIALLSRSYRFGPTSGIGNLARLVNEGRGADALALVKSGTHADIAWRTTAPGDLQSRLAAVVAEKLRGYVEAARANEAPEKIFALFNEFRLLCAHRGGRFGVTALNRTIEEALEQQNLVTTRDAWYAGRPVMITRNDYNLKLFNGDVGITLADRDGDGSLKVFFQTGGHGMRGLTPGRLPQHETVYAMTIHKAQGSEFGDVLLVLPNELSPIMSRELVYTGVTRAKNRVDVWGTEAVFCEAVERRLVRASALEERLWARVTAGA